MNVSNAHVALAPIAFQKPPQRSSIVRESPPQLPDRQPTVEVLSEPISGSRLGHLVGKIPVLRRLRKQDRGVAPVPVFEARPVLKTPDKENLIQPVSVDVKVNVGETGTVTYAEVTKYGDPPNWNIANAALAAAQRWTFEPARIEDTPVSSEVVLHFRFRQSSVRDGDQVRDSATVRDRGEGLAFRRESRP